MKLHLIKTQNHEIINLPYKSKGHLPEPDRFKIFDNAKLALFFARLKGKKL